VCFGVTISFELKKQNIFKVSFLTLLCTFMIEGHKVENESFPSSQLKQFKSLLQWKNAKPFIVFYQYIVD
jgi:hypothetical protein